MKRDRNLMAGTESDLTPMIDVVFLLLVFFMCTLSFAVLEGRLETQLPADRGGNPGAVSELLTPLDLGVEADASRAAGVTVRVGARRLVGVESLPAIIREYLAVQPDLRAKISTGAGVTYGQAVAVLDACIMAGMTDVMFTAVPL